MLTLYLCSLALVSALGTGEGTVRAQVVFTRNTALNHVHAAFEDIIMMVARRFRNAAIRHAYLGERLWGTKMIIQLFQHIGNKPSRLKASSNDVTSSPYSLYSVCSSAVRLLVCVLGN